MKGLFSIILSILMLLGSFKEAAIYFSFKMNQDYIAKNFCVEKDVEDSTCKGGCQLKEKIEETRKEEPQQTPTQRTKETQPIVIDLHHLVKTSICLQGFKSIFNSKILDNYSYQLIFNIFHPPQ